MARFVLDQRVWFEGRAVLDYGTGSGIAALAAAKSGARSVRALDHDPWSKVAVQLNARLNDVNIFPEIGEISYDKPILEDTVLLADMTYDAVTTANIVQWVRTLQTRKVTVWIADPGRGYISEDLFPRVATYSAPADIDVNGAYMVRTHIYRVC
ncbi:MAG: 50S ribosomal protein L11 methyltransferase [Myxococcales bacterium]|nr:50S ribosomal protein L11 methyltransferase [Myxococcales bacterium]